MTLCPSAWSDERAHTLSQRKEISTRSTKLGSPARSGNTPCLAPWGYYTAAANCSSRAQSAGKPRGSTLYGEGKSKQKETLQERRAHNRRRAFTQHRRFHRRRGRRGWYQAKHGERDSWGGSGSAVSVALDPRPVARRRSASLIERCIFTGGGSARQRKHNEHKRKHTITKETQRATSVQAQRNHTAIEADTDAGCSNEIPLPHPSANARHPYSIDPSWGVQSTQTCRAPRWIRKSTETMTPTQYPSGPEITRHRTTAKRDRRDRQDNAPGPRLADGLWQAWSRRQSSTFDASPRNAAAPPANALSMRPVLTEVYRPSPTLTTDCGRRDNQREGKSGESQGHAGIWRIAVQRKLRHGCKHEIDHLSNVRYS